MDGQRKTRKRELWTDGERRNKIIDEHLILLTMPRTIYFTKNYKN